MDRKTLIWLIVLFVALVVIVGCTQASGSAPPPSGPIGGGCGLQ